MGTDVVPQPTIGQPREPCRGAGGRIAGTRQVRDTQPTESTGWDSWGLAETRGPVGVSPRSSACMLFYGLEYLWALTVGGGISLALLPGLGTLFPPSG